MKIVYVILAHNNPWQLRRLISSLSAANVKFVVHIDIRVQLSIFLECFTALDLDSITFVKKRSKSSWGTFGIVEATLSCLKFVYKKLLDTDRVVLMSGHDYPIKNNQYICAYLKANPLSIYLDFNKIPYNIWWQGGKGRFPHYEKISEAMDVYAGSQWFSLPSYALKIVFDFIKINPNFIKYFRRVDIPDESFFQTLFLNCEEKIVEENLVNRGLHLIKWDSPHMHPRCLTEQHLKLIKRAQFLFARKFSADVPSKILDEIDTKLLYRNNPKILASQKLIADKDKQKCAVLFLTNKNDNLTLAAFNVLKKEAPKCHDVFLMYHQTRKKISKSISIYNPILFNDHLLHSSGFSSINHKLVPGSNHFPLFDYYKKHPDYDYYWYVEDDVRFNGSWDDFFDSFKQNANKSDFLTCHVRRYKDEPHWFWWETLRHKSGIRFPLNLRIRSFNPIFRISNRALAFLNEAYLTGWSGHHEVTMSSLLAFGGFSINDLGDKGEFVISRVAKNFYRSALPDINGDVGTGSMRFRPFIDKSEMTDAILYHPVKVISNNKTDWRNRRQT